MTLHGETPEGPDAIAAWERASQLAHLRAYPFLEPLSDGLLARLAPNVTERKYLRGETILRAGEYSDCAYYLKEGSVEVRITPVGSADPPTAGGGKSARAERTTAGETPTSRIERLLNQQVASMYRSSVGADGTVTVSDMPVDVRPNRATILEPGELFGEVNALARYALSSDVVAHTNVVCLAIRTPALRTLFKQPELAEFKHQVDNRYRQRTLGSHLRQLELFRNVNEAAFDRMCAAADLVSFEPGAVIVEQGATADAFYLVRGGFVKVAVRTGARDLAVTYLRKGDSAGEIALLLNDVWPFSLEALDYVELVRLRRDTFEAVIKEQPDVEHRLWDESVRRLKERGAVTRNPLTGQYLQMAMDTGLIHGESVMFIDLNSCTRCDDCVRACGDTHGGTPRFVRDGNRYRHWMVPTACYQCSDPACLVGCPTGAITRPLGTREVTINPDVCIACHNCSQRCPWGNILEVPFESPVVKKQVDLPIKCDLCAGREDGPACVQVCPHGALKRLNFKDLPVVTRTLGE